MENEIRIAIPKGMQIDKENSTFECIKFKKKELTYEDITKELFFHKESYSMDNIDIYGYSDTINYQEKVMAKSYRQLEKLLAINKLMNVAKYLNGDWNPDWKDHQNKYHIAIVLDQIDISSVTALNSEIVYFKTKELAQQAINILGEDTIKLALSTNW